MIIVGWYQRNKTDKYLLFYLAMSISYISNTSFTLTEMILSPVRPYWLLSNRLCDDFVVPLLLHVFFMTFLDIAADETNLRPYTTFTTHMHDRLFYNYTQSKRVLTSLSTCSKFLDFKGDNKRICHIYDHVSSDSSVRTPLLKHTE